MAKHNLDIINDEYFDFDIFSITCSESIYTVVNELNHALNIDFELKDLLDFIHKDGAKFYFPLYSFFHTELNIEFNLIPNQSSFQPPESKIAQQNFDLFAGDIEHTTKLLPELEKSDYFLIIKGDNRHNHNHDIFESFKKNPNFITCKEIYLETLNDKKSKNNLLF